MQRNSRSNHCVITASIASITSFLSIDGEEAVATSRVDGIIKFLADLAQMNFIKHCHTKRKAFGGVSVIPEKVAETLAGFSGGCICTQTPVIQVGLPFGEVGVGSFLAKVLLEGLGLRQDPGLVRMVGGRGNADAPGPDVQEDEHEQIPKAGT